MNVQIRGRDTDWFEVGPNRLLGNTKKHKSVCKGGGGGGHT